MLNLLISFHALVFSLTLSHGLSRFLLMCWHVGYYFSNGKLKRQDETRSTGCHRHQRREHMSHVTATCARKKNKQTNMKERNCRV